MPAKLIRFDRERRDPHRTYGVPATHRQAVIPITRKTARRHYQDAKQRRGRTIMRGMMMLIILLIVALGTLVWRLTTLSQTPAYRPTPVIRTLPRAHIAWEFF